MREAIAAEKAGLRVKKRKTGNGPLRGSMLTPAIDRTDIGVGNRFPPMCAKRRGKFGMPRERRHARREPLDHRGVLASTRDDGHQIGRRLRLPRDAARNNVVPVFKGPPNHGAGLPRSPFHHARPTSRTVPRCDRLRWHPPCCSNGNFARRRSGPPTNIPPYLTGTSVPDRHYRNGP